MIAIRRALVLAIPLMLTAPALADPRPTEAILGKWEMTRKDEGQEITVTMEFTREGRTSVDIVARMGKNMKTTRDEGTYRWINDETIEVTVDKADSERVRVRITDRELIITPKAGLPLKLTRVAK